MGTATHLLAILLGFALGVYLLPILTAPESPSKVTLESQAATALYRGEFKRDLDGSDLFHWGTGLVYLSNDSLTHQGQLAPGPDYQAYLAPQFVENESQFIAIKDQSINLGSIHTFEGFMIDIYQPVNLVKTPTIVIWCEAFGEFITAARLEQVD